jgi:hypothetical protein
MTPDTWTIIGTGLAIAVLLIGLVAWVRSDMKALEIGMKEGFRQLGDRLGAVERDVARLENEVSFVRGLLSLALPALAQPHTPPPAD